MNHLAHRIAAIAGAAVLGLSVTAPAQAARYDRTDAAGDVLQCDVSADCPTTTVAEPQNPDIRRVTFQHQARKVVVVARFTDLAKNSDLKGFTASIKTNEGVNRDVSVFAQDSFVGVDFTRPNGQSVRCSGIRRTVDYSANTVTVSVPRSCVSAPRWVKVGFSAFAMPGQDLTRVRIDDGLATGEPATAVYSPRIRRA